MCYFLLHQRGDLKQGGGGGKLARKRLEGRKRGKRGEVQERERKGKRHCWGEPQPGGQG